MFAGRVVVRPQAFEATTNDHFLQESASVALTHPRQLRDKRRVECHIYAPRSRGVREGPSRTAMTNNALHDRELMRRLVLAEALEEEARDDAGRVVRAGQTRDEAE